MGRTTPKQKAERIREDRLKAESIKETPKQETPKRPKPNGKGKTKATTKGKGGKRLGEELPVDCPCLPPDPALIGALTNAITALQAALPALPALLPFILGCCNPCKDVPPGKLYVMACRGNQRVLLRGTADGQVIKWDQAAGTWVIGAP